MEDGPSEKRVRRSTRYSGEYQFNFDASSDEEREITAEKNRRASTIVKTKRTKECPGCGAILAISLRECRGCDYQFTSKSLLVGQQSAVQESQTIRDKFPFEPERDDDGSLLIHVILGRRPRKTGRRWSRATTGNNLSLEDMTAMDSRYEYEFLIKYKSMSYLHTKWLTANDIESMSQKSKSALYRYLTKIDKGEIAAEEPDIDPSFTEVEAVLDVREEEVEEVVVEDVGNQAALKELEKVIEENDAADKAKEGISTRSGLSISAAADDEDNDADEDIDENGVSAMELSEMGRTPTQIFQAGERCRRVLDKICEDFYAASFIEPVDTDVYDDYLDTVEEPMSLSDVRKKLENNVYPRYNLYKSFAQDMRKIWRNCKQYNDYHSSIWFCANYLSTLFERLYQSWVVSFSDGSIPLSDPVARPWETPCRICLKDNNDDKMILCDHCDAGYHVYCLSPPMPKVPDDAWMCRRCLQWLARSGVKVLSASAEEEARNLIEGATSRKTVKVKRRKYLVKWRGLSYRECTWETKDAINDDEIIAEFHRINDTPPEEPPLTQAEIGVELSKDRKSQILPAGMHGGAPHPVADLDAEIYAQIRAYHFLKFNKTTPTALLKETGPAGFTHTLHNSTPIALPALVVNTMIKVASNASRSSKDAANGSSEEVKRDDGVMEEDGIVVDSTSFEKQWLHQEKDPYRAVVSGLLGDMVYALARDFEKAPIPAQPSRPVLLPRYQFPSEIEICVPKKPTGLCLKVGKFHDNVVVVGFRPDKSTNNGIGPVERLMRIKMGDFLVAINGVYVHHLKFDNIVKLMEAKQPYMYLRFLRIPKCKESQSVDIVERALEATRPDPDSKTPFPRRSLYFGVFPCNESEHKWVAMFHREHLPVILGVFDDELEAAKVYDAAVDREETKGSWQKNFELDGTELLTASARILHSVVSKEREHNSTVLATLAVVKEKNASEKNDQDKSTIDDFTLQRQIDGYHSEDSLDSESEAEIEVFSRSANVVEDADENVLMELDDEELDDEESEAEEEEEEEDEDEYVHRRRRTSKGSGYKPPKKKEKDGEWTAKEVVSFDEEGPVGRLLRAVNECPYPPIRNDWTKYIIELGMKGKAKAENLAARGRDIEQVDLVSDQVIKTWKNMLNAAKELSIPVADIFNCLKEDRDSAGGYRWRYGKNEANGLSSAKLDDDEDDVHDQRKDDSWQLKLPTKSKEYRNGNTLREYQVDGLNWLLRCWYTMRSSILADEMGLGKTAQVVTFLDHLFEVENIKGPFLVCVPLSTIGHWKREVDSWSNMRSCVYHDAGGGRDMRDIIREFEWYYKGRSRRLLKFHVLLTTYDDLVRDYEELAEVPWRVVVVDEAHRLKNVNSKLLDCLKNVSLRGQAAYGYQHRVLMTGTPLQNNTMELFSLLNFIETSRFPDYEKFHERFGSITTQDQVENLQRRIAPYMLRRVKEDVATDIPPKEETVIDVELTTIQKQYYRAIFEHNHGFLMQNTKGNIVRLMNIQMELRKCCNHPFLIAGVEMKEMEGVEAKLEEEASSKASGAARSKLMFDQKEFERRRMEQVLIPSSGKMVLLDKLLPKLRKEGHKVLIFSQMVKMIDTIEEYCEFRTYPCFRLDGRTSGNDRQKSIDKFNKDPNAFVFLLSTRAGGVGINLTAADIVIIFDSDWNPQNDIQAMARCHRIGQSKNVKIYRLITRRSFEQEMFDRASKKLGLEQAVLGTKNFQEIEDEVGKTTSKVDAQEMEQLLREGAYAVLMEDDSDALKDFFEQDIDKLLEQRARVLVTDGGAPTESWLNKKKSLSRTSKRMFTGDSAKDTAEIDVNDPDFWKKLLPDLVTPDTMLGRLNDDSLLEEDGEPNDKAVEKYMKDLTQMMDGMIDLSRRNQLPDHERAVCLKLLLRITLKEDIFDEDDRLQAQDWLSMIEGTRNRRGRQDLYQVEERKSMGPGKGGARGRPPGAKSRFSIKKIELDQPISTKKKQHRKRGSEDGSDDDDDEDGSDDEVVSGDEDVTGNRQPKKRGRKPKKKDGKETTKANKRKYTKKVKKTEQSPDDDGAGGADMDAWDEEEDAPSTVKRKSSTKKARLVPSDDGEDDDGESRASPKKAKQKRTRTPKVSNGTKQKASAKRKIRFSLQPGEGEDDEDEDTFDGSGRGDEDAFDLPPSKRARVSQESLSSATGGDLIVMDEDDHFDDDDDDEAFL